MTCEEALLRDGNWTRVARPGVKRAQFYQKTFDAVTLDHLPALGVDAVPPKRHGRLPVYAVVATRKYPKAQAGEWDVVAWIYERPPRKRKGGTKK